jgi:hypothetical protein
MPTVPVDGYYAVGDRGSGTRDAPVKRLPAVATPAIAVLAQQAFRKAAMSP